MARNVIDLLEDERPRHIGRFADDFRVHQVAEADAAGGDGRGDGDVVEHVPEVHLRLSAVEPQRYHQAERTAVRGKSSVAREFPRAVGHFVHRHEHFDEVCARGQEIVGFVEEAVAESCTDEDADERIDEERIEEFVLDFLVFIQPFHHEIRADDAHEPECAVPPQRDWSEVADDFARIPVYKQKFIVHI